MTSITYGNDSVWGSFSTSDAAMTPLDDTKFLVSYNDSSDTGDGKVLIATTDGTDTTYGTPYEFSSGACTYISIAVLTSTTFVVVCQDANNSYKATAYLGTISGSAISYGAAAPISVGIGTWCSVCRLSDTTFGLAYNDGDDSVAYSVVGSVTGTTISYGTPVQLNGGVSSRMGVTYLDETHFVVAGRDGLNFGKGTVWLSTVSGTAVTNGTGILFHDGEVDNSSVFTLSDTKFGIAYGGRPARDAYAIIGTFDGSSISMGTEQMFFGTNNASYIEAVGMNWRQFIVTAYNTTDANSVGSSYLVDVEGTVMTFNPFDVFYATACYSYRITKTSDTIVAISYQDVANSSYETIVAGTIPSVDPPPPTRKRIPIIDEAATVATLDGTETLTNKTIDGTSNTLTNVAAATVATITGLAPDTATTQATQPNITSAANLVTVGTIGTGTWQGTAVDGAYVDLEGTEVKSTGVTVTNKYLRADGDGSCSWQETTTGDPRVSTTVSTATLAVNSDDYDQVNVTAQAEAISVSDPTGTPVEGQRILYRFTDDGTARAITWGTGFVSGPGTLPSTTTTGQQLYAAFLYNSTLTKWECVGGDFPAPEGTEVLSTGETGATKFLREDGDDTSSWQTVHDVTGNAATVSTITGLAPDTATTQATQPNITSAVNLKEGYVAKDATYTVVNTDYQVECTANSFTVTLPTAVGITGKIFSIKNSGTGTITVDGDGTETIDGELTQALAQWDNMEVMSNGANYVII